MIYKINNKIRSFLVVIACCFSLLVPVGPGVYAQLSYCVDATDNTHFINAGTDISTKLNLFAQQEGAYIQKSNDTFIFIVEKKFKEYSQNIINWMDDFAELRLKPALADMVQQLSVNYMEQSLFISKIIDAKALNENYLEDDIARVSNHRRNEIASSSSVVDTFGPSLTLGYQAAKAAGYALLKDEMNLYTNTEGTLAERGRTKVITSMVNDYTDFLCNPDMGDAACEELAEGEEPNYEFAGKHKDIGKVLWGPDKTVDMDTVEGRKLLRYLMRYFLYPNVNEPIPAAALEGAEGWEQMLVRRSDMGRLNTIYYTLSQLLSERIGGNPEAATYIEEIRSSSDVPASNIAESAPSYREINETLNKDRFLMADYFIGLSAMSPEQVLKEQITLGAFRLQMMNDLFRRQEEMLLISSADYSRYLDDNMPDVPVSAISIDDDE